MKSSRKDAFVSQVHINVFKSCRYFSLASFCVVFLAASIGSILKFCFTSYPWTVCYMLYLNHAIWPPKPFIDFDNLTMHGVEGRNLYLTNNNGIRLGVWIVPPLLNTELERKTSAWENLPHVTQKANLPVILYVHGNAGSRAEFARVRLYDNLRRLGFTVVAFDYRGYGDSSGSPWGEMDLVHDGFSVYQMIRREFPGKEIFIWGHSLGTGVSTHLVQLIENASLTVDGLILDSPFSDLHDAMRRHPLLFPLHLVPGFTDSVASAMRTMQVNLNNSAAILTLRTPVLILHAEDDRVVPVELGRKLYSIAKQRSAPVSLVTFRKELGYGHRGIYKDPDLPRIVNDFVISCRNHRGASS